MYAIVVSVAAADPPAGGAELEQVAIATAMGIGTTVALLVLCFGHRSGRLGLLALGDRMSHRLLGAPGWVGVPSLVALVTLVPALFGLRWDESLHVSDGRDAGPLANPSHYFLLAGIFGAFAAGVLAIFMADDRVPPSGVRIGGWRAPLGGLLTAAGAGAALTGFPLDDVWHRIFGQDVTLWSPTHVLMITGLSLSVLGIVVLSVEGMRARAASGTAPTAGTRPIRALQRVMLPAALLLVLSLLQGEFDFGIPQFRLVFHPISIMIAAGVALTAARIFLGRGAAIGAVLAFLVIRGAISLLVGPVLGQPDHVFPLYLVEAIGVELVALALGTTRPLRFGLACGAWIATAGLAAEWAWSSVFRIDWPADLLPQAIALAVPAAIAASLLGAWLGCHLRAARPSRPPGLRTAATAACVVIAAIIGYGLVKPAPDTIRATVTLIDVAPPPQRTVHATVRVQPADAVEDADWLRSIAWQGGDLVSDPLRRVARGVYRTTAPIPVHGDWKTAIRFARGAQLSGVAIYLPDDSAIPVAGLAAPRRFERLFTSEAHVLRREAKDVAPRTWTVGTAVVAAIVLAMFGAWALALRRLALAAPEATAPTPIEDAPPVRASAATPAVTA